jgi:DNA mismatch repair protein MutS
MAPAVGEGAAIPRSVVLAQERSMQQPVEAFRSILFPNESDRRSEDVAASDCFSDLNLDQIVAAVTAGKEEYNLAPFFRMPLHIADAVLYRHEVMRDLEDVHLRDSVNSFALGMRAMRERIVQLDGRSYERQKDRWFLDAVELYGDAVSLLADDLSSAGFVSRGLLEFQDYLHRYAGSERFLSLILEAKRLTAELSSMRYSVYISGPRVEVRAYDGDADYSAAVETDFARFRQGAVQNYPFKFSDALEMNHVEAQILDGVAHLRPSLFAALAAFRAKNGEFLDPTVAGFDREIQFYASYLDYIGKFRVAGLAFCYPQVSDVSKEFRADCTFDLALAGKLLGGDAVPVTNDMRLEDHERIIVVSGPNQGGKTTTARTFGQLHYLASLGCRVPGTTAKLFLPDRIFTHFEREEHVTSLRGKLQDDLMRIHEILEAATTRSIIVINEIFASTTLHDAVFLSRRIGATIIALDALCIWITFIEEVASLGPQTVSMVATVVPGNPAQRTFKVVRQQADGLAYAMALAEKHSLTYAAIRDRLGR